MATALHTDLDVGEIHVPYNWTYATAVQREAATGFAATDVGKLAWQQSDNTLWMLVDESPPTWVQVSSGEGSASSSLEITVAKASAGTIPSGSVVHFVGYDAGLGVVTVEMARADSASTMPAIAITRQEVTDAVTGKAVTIGPLAGIVDTSAWAPNTALYVSASTAGALTSTRPTGTGIVQFMAIVCSQGNPGSVGVVRDMPASLPNLPQDKQWFGDSDAQPVAKAFGEFSEKATRGADDRLLVEDSAASYAKKYVKVGTIHPETQQASSDTESSTTSQAWQNKVTLSLGTLPAGTYRIGWYAEIKCSSISDDIVVRVNVDSSVDAMNVNIEVKDNSNYVPISGFYYATFTAASHTVAMDYYSESSGVTATIRRARLECVRVE